MQADWAMKKKPCDIPWNTAWFIGTFIMVYYNSQQGINEGFSIVHFCRDWGFWNFWTKTSGWQQAATWNRAYNSWSLRKKGVILQCPTSVFHLHLVDHAIFLFWNDTCGYFWCCDSLRPDSLGLTFPKKAMENTWSFGQNSTCIVISALNQIFWELLDSFLMCSWFRGGIWETLHF